jgi:dipeptidase E
MRGKRPVYLLAGGRPRNRQTPDPIIQAVFRESAKVSPTIAYVGTANGDNEDFFNRMAEMHKDAGASRVDHALISPDGADLKKAQDILKSADIVFISGGDVDRGVCVLREKNMTDFMTELYQQGKLFFGSSAGAIMLAKEWVRWRDPDDNTSAELFPCLGFAPVICDCHDEEGGWQELKAALRLKEDNAIGYGLVTGTAIRVFADSRIEALGGAIHQYIRHGKRVDRAPDILPVSNLLPPQTK